MEDNIITTPNDSEKITEERVDAFKRIFDYCEANGIDLSSPEFRQLSVWVTNELGINQKVSDLTDLKVEPESLSPYEFNRIIKKARTGIKQLVESRKSFYKKETKDEEGNTVSTTTFGPYFNSRKLRRGLVARTSRSVRASNRSSRASEIVKNINARRITL